MSNSSNLILYKASAGSGKTYTLAKEYLKIVILQPYDYKKILAVTFTRKATQEMKSRIIEYLDLLLKNDPKVEVLKNSIISELKEEKGIDINDRFDENANTALQLILHDYSNFNISTIDSFFQSIIRAFAKELDLPIGMEVELDTDFVIRHAVQNVLKEYKTDKDTFSKWIEEYVFDLIEEDKSWKIEKNIAKLAKQILSEEYQLLSTDNKQQFDIETYKNVLQELKKIVFDYRKKLDDLREQVEQKIETENLDLSLYFQGTKSVHSFINRTKEYAPEANSYVQKMLSGGDVYSASRLKDGTDVGALDTAWNNYLIYFINDVLKHKEQYHRAYNAADIVLKNIYSLALLEFINTSIKQYKADENLILISDTNQIISLIAQHEEVPFIFEKSANFLKYILIDEFQDTSSLQWKGVLPLLLEILQNINGLVLIVGDPKQSIYRWRGGKMELIIDGIAPDLSYHWEGRKDVPLIDNYRSAKEIVLFNNAFFSTVKETIALENPLFKNVLADVEQQIIKADAPGFVQCKWLEKNKDKQEDDVQLQEIVSTIRSLKSTHSLSDIAILSRNNIHGAIVANYLKDKDIPVVSAESLLLQNQLSVKLLIAALEYVLHAGEDFYCVKLNYLYAKFTKQKNLESYLKKQKEQSYFFEQQMPALSKKKVTAWSSVAINELVFLLMQHLGLDSQMNSYLWRFQDIVLQHSISHSNATQEFLEFWEEQKHKLSIVPPDGIDAVKIYTIHKSKGLQFPVVILPFASWSMKPKAESLIWLKSNELPFDKLQAFPIEMKKSLQDSLFDKEYNRELESSYMDNINLLYVAFTRAEEQLYIFSTAEKEDKKQEQLPQNVSKLLKSILSKLVLPTAILTENEFSFGDKNNTSLRKEKVFNTQVVVSKPFANYKEKIQLHRNTNYNEAQVKGNILHAILSKINQPYHLQKAIATSVINDVELYTLAAQKVLDIFAQNNWFDKKWQQLNERNLWYKNNLLRADRILLCGDECVIIDYKTGAKETKHIQQMKDYINAYSSFHSQKISAYLIYIENGEIVQIQ